MKTKHKFTVTLELSSPVKVLESDFEDFTENILNALVHAADTAGITPIELNAFTETIYVKCKKTGCEFSKELSSWLI